MPDLTQEIQHDGCRYSCYVKGKRVFCKRVDKSCQPLPWPEQHPQRKEAYVKALSPKLQAGYEILYNQVKSGEKKTQVLTNFYNFVRPQNFVYGSPRPIPQGVPNVITVIPIEKFGAKLINGEQIPWDWIDVIVTERKLPPKILDDYELAPLSQKAQYFFKVSNLSRYKILDEQERNEYTKWFARGDFSYHAAVQDFLNMAQEYFAKRYKTKGRYATTVEVAQDLLKQIGITEIQRGK